MLIRLIGLFKFVPFIKRLLERKYYATGLGTYFLNSFFKRILRINAKGDFLVHFTSRVNSPDKIIIPQDAGKEKVYLSFATSGSCYYQAINGIEIGTGTIWSYGCQFISANHSTESDRKHVKQGPIIIGKNVWLGSHVIVLPGVHIGDNVIVGAGSVVTKDLPTGCTAVGNPARII